jgi:hypothetical protein
MGRIIDSVLFTSHLTLYLESINALVGLFGLLVFRLGGCGCVYGRSAWFVDLIYVYRG